MEHFERDHYENIESCSFGTLKESVTIEYFQYSKNLPLKTRIWVEFYPSTHWTDPVNLKYEMGDYNDEWRISYSSGGWNDVTNKQLAGAMQYIWSRVYEIVSKSPLDYEDEIIETFKKAAE